MQLTISFQPKKHDTIKDVINHVVYSCGLQAKYIAAELGMSPSEFSQIIAGVDGRRFPVEKLPDLIKITAPKGHEVIYWLIEQFLADEDNRKSHALSVVESLLPELMKAVGELKK